MTRKERAIELQACILPLLRKHGRWEEAHTGPRTIKVLTYSFGEISILYRTPFQQLPKVPESQKYIRALLRGKGNRPYGLDIWHKGHKVLNLEWSDKQVDLVSFRSGEWEDLIRAECAKVNNS